MTYLYLASQSPRRQELLKQIGVSFSLLLPDAEEDAEALEIPLPLEAPNQYVSRVTLAKLKAAQARHLRHGLAAAPILAADTTVALDKALLGKPTDADDLRTMLQRLSGREHQVLTAVAIAYPPHEHDAHDWHCVETLSVSQVRFKTLSVQEIAAYIASGEGFGKAGGYGIQGLAACFVSHIAGSYSGIMGLPLFETAQLLNQSLGSSPLS